MAELEEDFASPPDQQCCGQMCPNQHVRQSVRTFCMQTSLHGWHYMVDRPLATFRTIFWMCIVSLSMVTAGTFLYNNTWNFVHSNVVTTVDTMTAPLTEVFFPSVVVCNMNQVRESFFAEHEPLDTITSQFLRNFTPSESGKTSSHQLCKDLFVYSKWNGSTTYNMLHDRDFGTDYGVCCWFTPQFNFSRILAETKSSSSQGSSKAPDWGHWFTTIEKGAKTGKDNGYTLLLDVESFDYKFSMEGSEGLKMALVHHLDMPIMRQIGFHISPGTENQIAVTPTLMGTSEQAMDRFSPEQRDCYSEDEISLKYLPREHGYRYEMSNCLFEAAFEEILEVCKCFPGFHAKDGELSNSLATCSGKDTECVNRLMNQMGHFDHVTYKGRKVKCRSNCEDQVNSVLVTSSAYPNKSVFVKRPEFCLTLTRLWQRCQSFKRGPLDEHYPGLCPEVLALGDHVHECDVGEESEWGHIRAFARNCTVDRCPLEEAVWRYARSNLALLNIFIKEPYARRFKKHVKTTMTSYVANSGGILGLCMGFSLISAAEILFHCLTALFPVLSGRKFYLSKEQRSRKRTRSLSWKERKYCTHFSDSEVDNANTAVRVEKHRKRKYHRRHRSHSNKHRAKIVNSPTIEENHFDSMDSFQTTCPIHGTININFSQESEPVEMLEDDGFEPPILEHWHQNQEKVYCHSNGKAIYYGPERFI